MAFRTFQRYNRRRYRPRRITGSSRIMRPRATREVPRFIRAPPVSKKLVRFFPDVPSGEPFRFNSNLNSAFTSATNIHLMNEIPLGDGVNYRTGNRVRMLDLHFRALLYQPVTTDNVNINQVLNLTIIVDRTPHGTQPDFNAMFLQNPLAPEQLSQADDYGILYSRTWVQSLQPVDTGLVPTSAGYLVGNRSLKIFDFHLPLNMTAVWMSNSPTGAVSTFRKNAIYFMFRSVASNDPNLNWRIELFHRLSFVEY